MEEVFLGLAWKEGQGDWQVEGAHVSDTRGLGWAMPEVWCKVSEAGRTVHLTIGLFSQVRGLELALAWLSLMLLAVRLSCGRTKGGSFSLLASVSQT